jgi:ankyrin repeat protein
MRPLLDLRNVNYHTPFFISIIKGFLDIAELLLQNGLSSIDVKDYVINIKNNLLIIGRRHSSALDSNDGKLENH